MTTRPLLAVLLLAAFERVGFAQGAVAAPPMNILPVAKVDGLPPAQDLDASSSTTCAVAAGEVWCWGQCEYGHCNGKKGAAAEPTPQKVPGLKKVTQVSVAPISACALHSDGGVSCWGTTTGVIGNSESPRPPRRVSGLPRSVQISHGPGTVCAIGVDRQVRCWGNNYTGELGQGPRLGPYRSPPPRPEPPAKPGEPRKVRPIQPMEIPSTDEDRPIVRIGLDESLKPLVVRGASDAIAIAVGGSHACAVRKGGKVVCWGAASLDEAEEQEDGTWTKAKIVRDGTLHEIALPDAAIAVNATDRESCAVLDDGRLFCWNYYTMSTPLVGPSACRDEVKMKTIDDHAWYAVADNGDVVRVVGYCGKAEKGVPPAVENSQTCARTSSGEVWCWGTNEHAQLGRSAEPFYRR